MLIVWSMESRRANIGVMISIIVDSPIFHSITVWRNRANRNAVIYSRQVRLALNTSIVSNRWLAERLYSIRTVTTTSLDSHNDVTFVYTIDIMLRRCRHIYGWKCHLQHGWQARRSRCNHVILNQSQCAAAATIGNSSSSHCLTAPLIQQTKRPVYLHRGLKLMENV